MQQPSKAIKESKEALLMPVLLNQIPFLPESELKVMKYILDYNLSTFHASDIADGVEIKLPCIYRVLDRLDNRRFLKRNNMTVDRANASKHKAYGENDQKIEVIYTVSPAVHLPIIKETIEVFHLWKIRIFPTWQKEE